MVTLDPYSDTGPLWFQFLMRTADVMTPRLSVVFRWLIRLDGFPCLLETG